METALTVRPQATEHNSFSSARSRSATGALSSSTRAMQRAEEMRRLLGEEEAEASARELLGLAEACIGWNMVWSQ